MCKTDRCLYSRFKEHSQENESEIFTNLWIGINVLDLTPYQENKSTITCILPEFILNNSKIIDKSANPWSLLLF